MQARSLYIRWLDTRSLVFELVISKLTVEGNFYHGEMFSSDLEKDGGWLGLRWIRDFFMERASLNNESCTAPSFKHCICLRRNGETECQVFGLQALTARNVREVEFGWRFPKRETETAHVTQTKRHFNLTSRNFSTHQHIRFLPH